MTTLLLAPYNASMRMGQGYNSFLQISCLDDAVRITESSLKPQPVRARNKSNVSQTVSYSSRFVERISKFTGNMNISAASSIKTGIIEVLGNSISLDQAKFFASDLNVEVGVKVVNQALSAGEHQAFQAPVEMMNSNQFFDLYGDCYISGFLEGGDLHAIVSIKILDATKKSEIESTLKGHIDGMTSDFAINDSLRAALSQTETTLNVSWCGGGQIKPDGEGWTLELLMRASASFPSRVAECPQRTWALLTPYRNHPGFLKWASDNEIELPDFSKVQPFVENLLDNYMEFKNNITIIQAVLADPDKFQMSPFPDAVKLDIWNLVKERKLLKEEMQKIVTIIDTLNSDPLTKDVANVKSAKDWTARLPVPNESALEN